MFHPLSSHLNAVSHDTTFPATCHATLTSTLRDTLQRPCHTLQIVLQRRKKYQRLLLFLQLAAKHFVTFQVAKRGCQAQFCSATCLATLQVAGNAARAFVRRRVRLKPPGTGYTGLTKDVAEDEKTVCLEVSAFAGKSVPGIPVGSPLGRIT